MATRRHSKQHLVVSPRIPINATWTQNGITVAGGNGSGFNQLSSPSAVFIDDDETVYIADYDNHRIMEWRNGETTGQVVVGGNGQGNKDDQLNGPTGVIFDKQTDGFLICDTDNRRVVRWPRDCMSGELIIDNVKYWGLTLDDEGFLYVTDVEKHEVQRWEAGKPTGIVVAGGNGAGDRLDQLNTPTYVVVDRDQSVYVSDQNNHRVMKWTKDAKKGIVVAGGQGVGDALTQLSLPQGLVVDHRGTVYVAESWNHRVSRWPHGATESSIIVGGNGIGDQANQLYSPDGLSFDRHGNLYVVDNKNHRLQKFPIVESHHD